MGRPAKNSNEKPAELRMQEAFWKVLAEKPYTQMTVADIARASEVNKNTLYYHYECLDDLAKQCVNQELPIDIINKIASGKLPCELLTELDEPNRAETLARLNLAIGPHGCGILAEFARNAALSLWFERFNLTESDLLAEEVIACRFVTSGMLSVFGVAEGLSPKEFISFVSSPLASSVISKTLEVLKTAQQRKENTESAR